MMLRWIGGRVLAAAAVLAWCAASGAGGQPVEPVAQGIVFHDLNANGVPDPGEPGIEGVLVSNQRDVVRTDAEGRWRLPVRGEATQFFVIKPSGWMTPTGPHNLPRHYYHHCPEGAPMLTFPGVPPTGPLPESIAFPLYPQEEPEQFEVIVVSDPQPRGPREAGYLARSLAPELRTQPGAFGITLGDVVFDNLAMFEPVNAAVAAAGRPWYNVIGNHDICFDAENHRDASAHFQRVYGPTYYAFAYGKAHFLALDNIRWFGLVEGRPGYTGHYRAGLGPAQLAFIANYLEHVPANHLIVLLMHIPLNNDRWTLDGVPQQPEVAGPDDRDALFALFTGRPHVLALAGHTHWQEHVFLGEDDGWPNSAPLHHAILTTASGSTWAGAPDVWGIPHATQRDGTPRGYAILSVDGNAYEIRYKAVGYPDDFQMNIQVSARIRVDEVETTPVYVNVFNGSSQCEVWMRVGENRPWRRLEQVFEPDPAFVALVERERTGVEAPYRPSGAPIPSPHLWHGVLPAGLAPGAHVVEIRSTGPFRPPCEAAQPIWIQE